MSPLQLQQDIMCLIQDFPMLLLSPSLAVIMIIRYIPFSFVTIFVVYGRLLLRMFALSFHKSCFICSHHSLNETMSSTKYMKISLENCIYMLIILDFCQSDEHI